MTSDFHVAFSVNAGGLPGFGATVASLINHCSRPENLRIHILASRLSNEHVANIEALFQELRFSGGYRFLPFDAEDRFQDLPSLHGDYATYGRLLIPELIDAPRVLYLDSDLVITCDVLALADLDLGGHVIAACSGTTIAHTLDRKYFFDRGFTKEMRYFNCGVILIDLDEWKRRDWTTAWQAIVLDRPESLTTHDQTIMNRLCAGDFHILPRMYNVAYLAHYAAPPYSEAIFHFIGSPKPWDVLGRYVHAGSHVWRANSPKSWEQKYQRLGRHRLGRAWSIRRSVGRSLKLRYLESTSNPRRVKVLG